MLVGVENSHLHVRKLVEFAANSTVGMDRQGAAHRSVRASHRGIPHSGKLRSERRLTTVCVLLSTNAKIDCRNEFRSTGAKNSEL